jgi:hypothetical protein
MTSASGDPVMEGTADAADDQESGGLPCCQCVPSHHAPLQYLHEHGENGLMERETQVIADELVKYGPNLLGHLRTSATCDDVTYSAKSRALGIG